MRIMLNFICILAVLFIQGCSEDKTAEPAVKTQAITATEAQAIAKESKIEPAPTEGLTPDWVIDSRIKN